MSTGYFFAKLEESYNQYGGSNYFYQRVRKRSFKDQDIIKDEAAYENIFEYPFHVNIDECHLTFYFKGILKDSKTESQFEIFKIPFDSSEESIKQINRLLLYDIEDEIGYETKIYEDNEDFQCTTDRCAANSRIKNANYFNSFIFEDYFLRHKESSQYSWFAKVWNKSIRTPLLQYLNAEKKEKLFEPKFCQRMLLHFLHDYDLSTVFKSCENYNNVLALQNHTLCNTIWLKAKYYYEKSILLNLIKDVNDEKVKNSQSRGQSFMAKISQFFILLWTGLFLHEKNEKNDDINTNQNDNLTREINYRLYRWMHLEVDLIDILTEPKSLKTLNFANKWVFKIENEVKILLFGDRPDMSFIRFILYKFYIDYKKICLLLGAISIITYLFSCTFSQEMIILLGVLFVVFGYSFSLLYKNTIRMIDFDNLHLNRDYLQIYYRDQKEVSEPRYQDESLETLSMDSQRMINNFFLNRFSFIQAMRNVLPIKYRSEIFFMVGLIVFLIGIRNVFLVYNKTSILSAIPDTSLFLTILTASIIFFPLSIFLITRFHYENVLLRLGLSTFFTSIWLMLCVYLQSYGIIPFFLLLFMYRAYPQGPKATKIINTILYFIILLTIVYNSGVSPKSQLFLTLVLSLYLVLLLNGKKFIHKHRLTFNIILPRMQMAIMSSWLILLSSEELIKSALDMDNLIAYIVIIATSTFAFSLMMFLHSIKLPDLQWFAYARRSIIMLVIGYVFSLSFGFLAIGVTGHNILTNTLYLKKYNPEEISKVKELKEIIQIENRKLQGQDQYFEKLLPFPVSFDSISNQILVYKTDEYAKNLSETVLIQEANLSDLMFAINRFNYFRLDKGSPNYTSSYGEIFRISNIIFKNVKHKKDLKIQIDSIQNMNKIMKQKNKSILEMGLTLDSIKTILVNNNDEVIKGANLFLSKYNNIEEQIQLSIMGLDYEYKRIDLLNTFNINLKPFTNFKENPDRFVLHVYPKLLLLFSIFALFAGIFFQVIIQDRSVTDPFE